MMSRAKVRTSSLWLTLAAISLGALMASSASSASAQNLSARYTDRATRAAVRITVRGREGTSHGSGSVIDPRGYVLTNFHVVGHMTPFRGAPGTLMSPTNEVELAMVTSPRENARTRYIGRVVRADARLDLALVRIVRDVSGASLRGQRFPTVPLGRTQGLRPGQQLFAFGFPLGVHTINVTGGGMTGFQMNAENEVAWIRTDAEFNPGNSGGMLLDDHGRLVAVPTALVSGRGAPEPIELARPVERIPEEWTQAMRRGHIDDVSITGVMGVAPGGTISDRSIGDVGNMVNPEIHYFTLPTQRPARISVTPSLPMALVVPGRGLLREGRGSVVIGGRDPASTMLAIVIPSSMNEQAVDFSIRHDQQMGGWAALPPPGSGNRQQPPQVAIPGAIPRVPGPPRPQNGGSNTPVLPGPGSTPPPGTSTPVVPGPQGPPGGLSAQGPMGAAPVGPAGALAPAGAETLSSIRGRIVEADSGLPVTASIVIARPGVDLSAHIAAFLGGQIDAGAFEQGLLAFARTGLDGSYELSDLPTGRYEGAAFGSAHRPARLQIEVRPGSGVVEMSPIRLER